MQLSHTCIIFKRKKNLKSLEVSTVSPWSLFLHVAKHFCSLSGQDIGLTWKASTIAMSANGNRDGSYLHRQRKVQKGKVVPSSKTRAQAVMKSGRAVWKGLDAQSLCPALCVLENCN